MKPEPQRTPEFDAIAATARERGWECHYEYVPPFWDDETGEEGGDFWDLVIYKQEQQDDDVIVYQALSFGSLLPPMETVEIFIRMGDEAFAKRVEEYKRERAAR